MHCNTFCRYLGRNIPRYFRADAAFAKPEVYEYLEAQGYEYAIRLPANDALLRDIEPLLTRPVGRPANVPVVWYAGFLYQAQSWNRARRVVAKVEWHNGELFPRVGFIVTNLSPARQTGGAVLATTGSSTARQSWRYARCRRAAGTAPHRQTD